MTFSLTGGSLTGGSLTGGSLTGGSLTGGSRTGGFLRTVGRIGAVAVLLGIAAVVVSPDRADAHGIGGVRPSNYETRVLSVRPAVRGIHVSAVDLGNRLELRNTSDADVTVVGYDDEPYLRVGPRGVFENRRSPAVYLNRTRNGTASAPVPKIADPEATPEWHKLSDGTTARWHDHRAHWMGSGEAPVVQTDPASPHLVQRFEVQLRRSAGTISVRGDVRWVPGPSPWPWIAAAVVLALTIVALSRSRFASIAIGTTLVVVALSETLHVVGGWGATTVSGGTKLAASVYALGGIVVAVLALIWLVRRGLSAAAPLVLIAGLFVVLAGGLADITVLTKSQLPTTLSPAVARLTVTLALGLGLGLAVAGALRLRPDRPPRRRLTRSTPSVPSPTGQVTPD